MSLTKVKNFIKALYSSILKDDSLTPGGEPVFLEINRENKSTSKIYHYPKIIWLYWDEPKSPLVVELCVKRIKDLCPEFEVFFLNKYTIKDFIEIDEIPHKLPNAIVADLIRLKLLAKYGGVWCDSSIFFNDNLDWVFDKINNQDAFLFYSDECTVDLSHPISENWFIVAPLHSDFILEWCREFERCIFSTDPVGYYHEIIDDKALIQNLSKPDYLLCYISAIKIMNEYRFNILYSSSLSVGHYYNYLYSFNYRAIAFCFLLKNKKKLKDIRLVKLTSQGRNKINSMLSKRLFFKSSLLGGFYVNNLKNNSSNHRNMSSYENPPNRR